tara:strand:- start:366 stop:800 length:435 start_codon:yes stop_codon:yes gene_type:complete
MTNSKETGYKFKFEKFENKDDTVFSENKVLYGHKFTPALIEGLFDEEKTCYLRNYYHDSHLNSFWTKSFLVMPDKNLNKVSFRNARSTANMNFGYMQNKLIIPEKDLLEHPSYKYIKERKTSDLGVTMLLKDVYEQIKEHFKNK